MMDKYIVIFPGMSYVVNSLEDARMIIDKHKVEATCHISLSIKKLTRKRIHISKTEMRSSDKSKASAWYLSFDAEVIISGIN